MANILEHLLQFGAFVIVIPLMLIPIIYHIADQQNEQITTHALYSTFDSDIFNEFENKLDTKDRINIFGSKQDQIEHFANHYASIKNKKGWKVINWDLNDETNFKNTLLLGQIRSKVEAQVDLEQEKKVLWIIDCNIQDKSIRKQATSFILKMVQSHSSSKFLVISNSGLKVFDSLTQIKGFKQYQVPQIDRQHFIGQVSTKLGLNENQGKIVINHFGSVLQTLQATKEKEFTLENILGVYFRNFTNQSPKQLEILSKLCQKGKVKSSEQLQGVQKMGAYLYQGVYYWRSPQSILNYKLLTQKKKCVFYDPGLPQYLIPSDPYETIFDYQQVLQQQLEQRQDFYQSIDDDNDKEDQPNDEEDQPNNDEQQAIQQGDDNEQKQQEDQKIIENEQNDENNVQQDIEERDIEEIPDIQNINQQLIEDVENQDQNQIEDQDQVQAQNQNEDQNQNQVQGLNQEQIQDDNKQEQKLIDEANIQQDQNNQQDQNTATQISKDSVSVEQTEIQQNKQEQQKQILSDEQNNQINGQNLDEIEVLHEGGNQVVQQPVNPQNSEQILQQQPNVEVKPQQKKEQSETKTQNKV